jgi:hypothetical protein
MSIFLCRRLSGKGKKMNHLCALGGSAVKYLPFDFDLLEAMLRHKKMAGYTA